MVTLKTTQSVADRLFTIKYKTFNIFHPFIEKWSHFSGDKELHSEI